MIFLILSTSIVLQLIAAILVFRLLRTTNFVGIWLCIGSAFCLMAARRSISLYSMVYGDSPMATSLPAELTALLISILMLCGAYLIRPFILSVNSTADKLRESEAMYRSVLDNMTDTYYRTDKLGLITMGSRSVKNLLGYQLDELLGKSLSGLYVNPKDRDKFLERLVEAKRVEKFESLLRHKDGSHVLVETNAHFIIDADGNPNGVEGVVRNITQRRHTELLNARLGRIIEDSANEVYTFDAETLMFTLVNKGARRNLGYTMDELLKLTPVDLKPQFNFAEFNNLLQPLRDGHSEVLDIETQHARKDGTLYPVEIHLQFARAEDPPIFVAIVQDISERKQSEAQLFQARKMEAVGQLTGGIAHDFNNLLTVIQGNIELAQSSQAEPGAQFLKHALSASEKGATLTQRLLAFSRKQVLEPEIVDICSLFTDMNDLLQRALRDDIDIKIINATNLWPCEVDPAQLENVLLNLAINAQDAMPQGGKLTIETANTVLDDQYAHDHFECTPGEYVLLTVSDTGTGIPSEVLANVFEPFFTTKGEGEGSGLGLSMVYGFVRQSGGSIDIYSEVDQGTTVKIYLPRTHEIPGARVNVTLESGNVAGAGEVILLVEDNQDLSQVVARMLGSLGYCPHSVSDVPSAIAFFETHGAVDLLLTDIILKGIEKGTDLAKTVNERWPETRVLYMSGYTQNAVIHEGRLDTGVELLAKPFSRQELALKVAQILKRDCPA